MESTKKLLAYVEKKLAKAKFKFNPATVVNKNEFFFTNILQIYFYKEEG